MLIIPNRSVPEKPLHDAALAAHHLGHSGKDVRRNLLELLDDRMQAVVLRLTEPPGDTHALAESHTPAGLGSGESYEAAPMIRSGEGDVR